MIPETTRTREQVAKALKLLEAMVEPCEKQRKSGDHEWRKCRRCLAHREAETDHGVTLLAILLAELRGAVQAEPPAARKPVDRLRCRFCNESEMGHPYYGSFAVCETFTPPVAPPQPSGSAETKP